MKIFIIGPEGSGKTVLLAMLGRYVATERKDLVLEPLDRVASKYVIDALEILERGDWPPSTRQAELPTLLWRFGVRGAPLHEIVIFDAAGQDLRQILLAVEQKSLTAKQQAIRTQIDAADVLVYLLDLNGFLGSEDISLRDENAWLFKTFLTKPEWRNKRRLVVLAKADIYKDMLETPTGQETEGDLVRELVKNKLPRNYTLGHLVDANPTVSYLAITSVATKTAIDQNGDPVRLPKNPLESVGISKLIEALLEEAAGIDRRAASVVLALRLKQTCIAIAIAIGILLWGFFYSVSCEKCAGLGRVSMKTDCSRCKGTGEVDGTVYGKNPCSNCKASGFVNIPVSCPACKGSGKILWWKN